MNRIRDDRARASVQVAELLGVIEDRLLDPDLQVVSMLPGVKIDKNLITLFNREVGLTPWAYITQCRMEVAGRMLASTEDIPVWRVGTAVGYLTPKSFTRVFKKWTKLSPREFRLRSGKQAAKPPLPRELLKPDEIQRAVRGDLPPAEAAAIAGRLGRLQDQILSNYQLSSAAIPRTESIEPMMARNVWRWIKDQPEATQQAAIESQSAAFRTPALFHLLCTKSIAAGLEDDVLGAQISGLALMCLPALISKLTEPEACIILIRGHIIAGLAMQRCGKINDALEYYGMANRMLDVSAQPGHLAYPALTMELCLYWAILELERDNLEAGKMLLNKGHEIMRLLIARLRQPTGPLVGV